MSSPDPAFPPTTTAQPTTHTDSAPKTAGAAITPPAAAPEAPTIQPSADPIQDDVSEILPPPATTAGASDSIESSTPVTAAAAAAPVVRISLLLTTGTRHPMALTRNYLRKRNMLPDDEDPFSITVYQLKQMIWNDWKPEWSAERPSSPSYIRLIFFGSMLSDTAPLRDTRFNRSESNVVHMTIKPQELIEDDEKITKDTKKDPNTRSGSMNCCIIL